MPVDAMTPPPMNAYDHGLLRFSCHFCGIELEVPVELGGETAPCPSCGLMITAPVDPGEPGPLGQAAPEVNRAEWEAVLAAQREEAWRTTEIVPERDEPAPVVGFGQLISAHPLPGPAPVQRPAQPVLLGDRMTSPPLGARGRGVAFPVTVTLLSLAIVGLSGVLIWRSELWRPGLGSSFAGGARPGEERVAAGSEIRERAEMAMKGMAEASVPVWPARGDEAEDGKSKSPAPGGQPVAEQVAAKPAPAKELVADKLVAEAAVAPKAAQEEKVKGPEASVMPAPAEQPMMAPASVRAEAGKPGPAPVAAPVEPAKPVAAAAAAVAVTEAKDGPGEAKAAKSAPAASAQAAAKPTAEGVPAEVIPVAGMIPEEAPPAVTDSPESGQAGQVGTSLDRARESIRRFLEAERWQERVPFIFDGESRQTALREYFQSHPDRAVKDYRLDFFHSETGPEGGSSIFVFFLTMEQEEDGFPVIVKSDRDGKKFGVDWDLHVEFKDRHFARFVEKKQEGSREFRVVIQRVTYWEEDRDQIPGIEDLVCYKIDPPYPGYTQYAFVEKGSDEGKKMVEALSWETDPLAAKVRVVWAKFPNGRSFLRVTELVARSWAE